jgi:hypothetical protein
MTTQEIRTLPIDEKVRIMAAIWEDMRDHYEDAPISQDVIDLLKERRSRINRGEAQLLDWDKVKFAIGRGRRKSSFQRMPSARATTYLPVGGCFSFSLHEKIGTRTAAHSSPHGKMLKKKQIAPSSGLKVLKKTHQTQNG